MRRFIAVLALVILFSTLVSAGAADLYVNGSEPAFLEDVGPQDERANNPWAAVIVGVAVLLAIYNGLRRADKLPERVPR